MPSAFGLETLWAACGHAGIPGACRHVGNVPAKVLAFRDAQKREVFLPGGGDGPSAGKVHFAGGGWRAEALKEEPTSPLPGCWAQHPMKWGPGGGYKAGGVLGWRPGFRPSGLCCPSCILLLTRSAQGHAAHPIPGEPHQDPVASASSEWGHCHSSPLPRRPIWARGGLGTWATGRGLSGLQGKGVGRQLRRNTASVREAARPGLDELGSAGPSPAPGVLLPSLPPTGP